MKHLRRHNYSNGFTLVELTIIIAIIGLLIALLLPAFERARTSARNSIARSTVHNLSMAIKSRMYDNNGVLDVIGAGGNIRMDLLTQRNQLPGGPYFSPDPRNINGTTYNDPWGNPYIVIQNPPTTGAQALPFGVYSWGRDGNNDNGVYNLANNQDDIASWR